MNMFQEYQTTLLDIGQVAGRLAIALACGLLISLVYRRTHAERRYSTRFVNSIISLPMITAIVVMVIGNNLARAFGLVGAMSLIRFRTAIKDPEDTVFIFFSLAVGMAAGVGLHSTAITGTVFISIIIYILSRVSHTYSRRLEFSLQSSLSGEQEAPYLPVLEKYCKRYEPVNVRSRKDGDLFEFSFHVTLKDVNKSEKFIREIGQVPGVSRINLFFDKRSS
ncbi:MAG: DUF4956 domain-containing protein [Chloroflexota bacterium]|nr:DUF4956 domain-containing protein [Chloroflexota bacterium]